MRKYINKLLKYFGYVPEKTTKAFMIMPDYKQYVIQTEATFPKETIDALGSEFNTLLKDELSKRMLSNIREHMAISEMTLCDTSTKRYQARLFIYEQ